MLWQIDDPLIDAARLGSLSPTRVLFEFDGPRTFVASDLDGELLLLHQCGESPEAWRYFVVPFSASLSAQLEEGRLDLRGALDQPRLWIADLNSSGVARLFRIDDRAAVEKYLPLPGTMLLPDLEPYLSVRSMGAQVELGRATLGVLRTALDNVRGALKTLAEFATGEIRKPGQPSAKTRRYYDLPALILAGSVRVSVLPRADGQQKLFDPDDIWQRMEALLRRGFREALAPTAAGQAAEAMDDELRAALNAVYLLAPPAYGPVEMTEISGRLAPWKAGGKPIAISRQMRATLRERLRLESEHQPQLARVAGFISELDREEATCLLRDKSGNTLRKLSFEDPYIDRVKEAFDSEREVAVVYEFTDAVETADLRALTFVLTEAQPEATREVVHG